MQLWLLCTAALALHILPLLMADMPFLDDFARQQLASNDWGHAGRPLVVALFAALSFDPGAVNLYPLPLLLAVLLTGDALARLVRHWFATPTLSAVLVVLPLWYQPFFLQNLSYQYDGATMALALAACLWAIVLGARPVRGWLYGALLVAAAAALYQPAVNLFAALCGLEAMRRVIEGARLSSIGRRAVARLGQLLFGCLLYYASSAWMVSSTRGGLLALDGEWLGEIYHRLAATADVVGLLITPVTGWIFLGLALLASLALGRQLVAVWRRPLPRGERLGLMLALLLPVPLIVLCVPGLILLLAEFEQTVRVLLGLGVALALLSYLAHDTLAGLPRARVLLLTIPLLFMLSYSYAYGRVLVLQKTLHQSIAQALAHDLSSSPSLVAAKHCYVLGFWLRQPWIPAAEGTLQAMPAIARIHAYNYLVLPEMLPRVGIDDLHTFYGGAPLDRQQVLASSPTPQVSSRFYDIHLLGDTAYVLVRPPPGSGQ
ncbi:MULTISPECIES: glucosyltransferase domain-containing protein [unclassified Pseudomonas]|uniref:glucosyltransferase domain-containing protein n=1 Tax=unclassified Pseudomonas TaxID=196821 RepID=UPI002446A4C1|nr:MULTISPECIES: glucosyltransferase domain-containing protein [unclassified Pseudomonas]MDH0303028.1 glucosyltransferase domain-containing protein [Pseudomonas sp. GD04091]MDH1986347.1 glucosyltransferase domain-containing protein [Pseudomonas sp. GD03689]